MLRKLLGRKKQENKVWTYGDNIHMHSALMEEHLSQRAERLADGFSSLHDLTRPGGIIDKLMDRLISIEGTVKGMSEKVNTHDDSLEILGQDLYGSSVEHGFATTSGVMEAILEHLDLEVDVKPEEEAKTILKKRGE